MFCWMVLMLGCGYPVFAFNTYELYIITELKKVQEEKDAGRQDSIIRTSMEVYYTQLNQVLHEPKQALLDTYLTEVAEGHEQMRPGIRKRIQKKFGQEFYNQVYWILVDLRMIKRALLMDTHRQAVYYDKNKHQGHCECGKCGND